MKTLLNTTGVIFSAVGSVIVWYYIAQLNFADREEYLKGNGVMTIPDPTPAEVKKFKREMLFSKIGISLIVIGGVLQVISNHMQDTH